MGTDKGQLKYHGVPHRDYLYDLVSDYCERTFLSIRKNQKDTIGVNRDFIVDKDCFKGPFNGILSASEAYPAVAWMVFACDLPFLDAPAIELLYKKRNPDKVATVFATNKSGLPEPLCAIWEPKGLKAAKEWLNTSGTSCPRKFLINSEIELVFPEDDSVLFNANFESDYKEALNRL